jgi:hypothetical protein
MHKTCEGRWQEFLLSQLDRLCSFVLLLYILAKDIGGFSRFFFVFSAFFSSRISKTSHLPKVLQSEPPLFTKIEGNAHGLMLRILFVAEQRF